jgi:hypothetical protein
MRADGACDDDDEEQRGDYARDAVQYDHCHCGRRRWAQRIRLIVGATGGSVAICAALDDDLGLGLRGRIVNGVEERGGHLLVGHGEDGEVLQHLLAVGLLIAAVVGHGAVQDDARDVLGSVDVLEDALGVGESGVVGWVAADVCNVAGLYVVAVVVHRVEEVARHLSDPHRQHGWTTASDISMGVGRTVILVASSVNGTSSAICVCPAMSRLRANVPWNPPNAVELFDCVMVAVAAVANSRHTNCEGRHCRHCRRESNMVAGRLSFTHPHDSNRSGENVGGDARPYR